MSVLFGFLSQKLGIEKDAQCLTLLREAFPNIEMKEIVDCQMVFGIKQKRNLEQVDLPIFTDEDQSHFDDVMLFLEHNSLAIDQKHSGEPSMVYSSTGTNIVPISGSVVSTIYYQLVVLQIVIYIPYQIPLSSNISFASNLCFLLSFCK